ncbi:TonB-dependent receptor [Pseudomonas sp. GW456-12-1-14-TSB6]|uniref:TonB-dependent receptor n=1 Tax=Pseudomonas sp. GW456-12-1-14-TSB6 TaxID=2751350 RepID=UPI000CD2DF27|nr:TonB-dependent receptor [Pseudomonas sp. GW456-12-1-14-TSB6]POA30634.1 TonB-dependent siderophore receptor [Pseudomonas sp. GW456-12-1-14-TSB6]
MTAMPSPRPATFALKALNLSLALAFSALLPSAAHAADSVSESASRSVNIGPGLLSHVLAQFAVSVGVPLSFDPAQLGNRQSPGLQGSYTAQSGFARLLEGSGFELISTGHNGYTVAPKVAADGALELGATNVSALRDDSGDTYGGEQVARRAQIGMLGNQEVNDLPFSVTSYTAKTMADQQAQTVGDVLLNDASVRQSNGFGNFSQMFMIRGLPLASDDISYNGLYGVLPRQIIAVEALDRVELFKGPNAFVNGVTPSGSGIGGGINLQPKRAMDTPTRSVTLDYSADGRVGGHLDLGQRFGEDNRFGARVNLMQREGDTAVDDEDQRSSLFSVGLDYRGDRLRVSTDFGYQKQVINQGRSVIYVDSSLTKAPKVPHANASYAQSWSYSQLEDTFGMARAEYDLNDNWTAYVSGGAKHTRENGVYSSLTVIDLNGSARGGMLYSPHDEDNQSAMAGLNGRFDTGPVTHQLNLGWAGIWGEQRSAFETIGTAGRYSTNLYNVTDKPRPAPTSFASDINDPRITGKNTLRSEAISDTLGFVDDRILLTLGVRRQELKVDGWSTATGARTSSYEESITTPVYGLVIKPWEHVSFYANRIEGLAKGPTPPTTAINRDETFAPVRSKQIEAGVRLDMGSYGANLGVYRIEQPSSYTQDGIFRVDGQQTNKGVELNVYGEPLDGLRLLSGATVMKTELEGSSNGVNDGNRAVGVPRFQFNLGADWDIPGLEGAALSARMLRTGGQYLNAANTQSIPAWNRFDLGSRYAFKLDEKQITLRANLENVANEAYWASANGGYLTQGTPRTLKVSATVDF